MLFWYTNKIVVPFPLQSTEKSPTSVFTRLFINCVTPAVVICDKTLTKKIIAEWILFFIRVQRDDDAKFDRANTWIPT